MKSIIEPMLTIADLDATPDDGNRYELIEGEIYMSRSPSLTHQQVVHNLDVDLGLYLRNNPIGVLVPGAGIVFDDFNGVIPDLLFVSNERWAEVASGERLSGPPDLVIEVLSPGAENERRDRNLKKKVYGRFGVKEYWIVDPVNRAIEVYSLRKRGMDLIATFSGDQLVKSAVLPGLTMKVSDAFKLHVPQA